MNLRGIVSNRPLALHSGIEMCTPSNIDVCMKQRLDVATITTTLERSLPMCSFAKCKWGGGVNVTVNSTCPVFSLDSIHFP